MPLANRLDLVVLLHLDESLRDELWNELDDFVNGQLGIPFFLDYLVKHISLVVDCGGAELGFADDLRRLEGELVSQANLKVEFVYFFAEELGFDASSLYLNLGE